MSNEPSAVRARNKPVNVYTTDPAEWDIAGFGVDERVLSVMAEALAAVPVSERDVVEGAIRYRQFRDLVVMFHYSSLPDEFIVDIIGVRPPQEMRKSEVFLNILEKLATLRSSTGV